MSAGPTTRDPAAIAAQILDVVRARTPSAEAEVTVRTGTNALTRFANSFIHQNVAEDASHVSLRVALDGRTALAMLDGPLETEALERLVDGAIEAAQVRPEDPDWPGLAPVRPTPDVEHWDEATAAADPDDRAAIVRAFVDAAGGLETAGACSTSRTVVAFANTAGQEVRGRGTSATIDGIARTGAADGSARLTSVSVRDLDGAGVGARAAGKARGADGGGDLEPGRYEVILEPQPVASILQFLFTYGFNGRAVEEGRSFVRLGDAQFDRSISLRDDATDAGTIGLGFDAEGTPKRRTDVVVDGVTSAVIHTRRTAATAGSESTGAAVEGGDQLGALATNPVLGSGDASVDDLIGGVERGLLVTDFWYTRILDPRTQVVTGLTRNGVWLIEGGRIARSVSNLRFTQSFLDALAPGAVKRIGRDRALVRDGLVGTHLVPSLHLASWNFTGGAKG
jgi:predicted Zn-dependent protease